MPPSDIHVAVTRLRRTERLVRLGKREKMSYTFRRAIETRSRTFDRLPHRPRFHGTATEEASLSSLLH